MTYRTGDTIKRKITIKDVSGTLVDPSALEVKVLAPDNTSSTITYTTSTTAIPGIERVSLGVYVVRALAAQTGVYSLRARTTINGDVGPTIEQRVTVEAY